MAHPIPLFTQIYKSWTNRWKTIPFCRLNSPWRQQQKNLIRNRNIWHLHLYTDICIYTLWANLTFALLRVVQIWHLHYYALCKFDICITRCENLIFALLRVVQIWQLHYALSKLEIFYTLCKFAHVYYTLSKFDICIISLGANLTVAHYVQIWKFHQTLCKINIFLLLTTGSMPIRHLRIEPFVEENK